MFEITQEEKTQIEEMHSVQKKVDKELNDENTRLKKEWQSFADLLLVYRKYVRVSAKNSIKYGLSDFYIMLVGSTLTLAFDHGYDNFYILKKIINKKMLKKEVEYKIIAKIETWTTKSITLLYFDYHYIAEIEQLYQELKQDYKEKVEKEIQDKTVEVETLKLVCPNFN